MLIVGSCLYIKSQIRLDANILPERALLHNFSHLSVSFFFKLLHKELFFINVLFGLESDGEFY